MRAGTWLIAEGNKGEGRETREGRGANGTPGMRKPPRGLGEGGRLWEYGKRFDSKRGREVGVGEGGGGVAGVRAQGDRRTHTHSRDNANKEERRHEVGGHPSLNEDESVWERGRRMGGRLTKNKSKKRKAQETKREGKGRAKESTLYQGGRRASFPSLSSLCLAAYLRVCVGVCVGGGGAEAGKAGAGVVEALEKHDTQNK